MRIEIVYEDDDLAIVDKPRGIPSAPLKPNGCTLSGLTKIRSALEQACDMFPEIRAVAGMKEGEHGLIHRLDTDASGLLLIAKNQSAFDFLKAEQTEGRVEKSYRALVTRCETQKTGFPPPPVTIQPDGQSVVCRSRFRAWGRGRKEVRPVSSALPVYRQCEKKSYAEKKAGEQIYETSMRIQKIDIEKLLTDMKNHTIFDDSTLKLQNCGYNYLEKLLGSMNNYTNFNIPITGLPEDSMQTDLEKLSASIQNHTSYMKKSAEFHLENLLACAKNQMFYCTDCMITRGFRHQVRAHLAWCGFPVVGDPLYSCDESLAPLQFYAASLRFRHPASEKFIEVSL